MYFKCNWNIEKLKIKNGFQTIVCDPFFVTVNFTSLYESIIFYLLYAFQVQLIISCRFLTFALLLDFKKAVVSNEEIVLVLFTKYKEVDFVWPYFKLLFCEEFCKS